MMWWLVLKCGFYLSLSVCYGESRIKAPDSFRRLMEVGPSAGPTSNFEPTMKMLDEKPPSGLNIEQQMGFWFQKIVGFMNEFEKLKPSFAQIRNFPPNADAKTRSILSGQESENLHVEFLRLQEVAKQWADNINAMPSQFAESYLRDLEMYTERIEVHIEEAERALGMAMKSEESDRQSSRGVGNIGPGQRGGVGVGIPIKLPENLTQKKPINIGGKRHVKNSETTDFFPKMDKPLPEAPKLSDIREQLGSQAIKQTRLEKAFFDLQNGMAEFETLKPLFGQATQVRMPSDLTDREHRILRGMESEHLNRRFLALQEKSQRIADPGSGNIMDPKQEVAFTEEVEKFVSDMIEHTDECKDLFKGLGLQIPEYNPRAPMSGMAPGGGQVSPKIAEGFAEIQQYMQRFEGLAPRFSGVTPAILNQASIAEKGILRGETSQKLHERFLMLQQRAPNSDKDQGFVSEMRTFISDLALHIEEATTVLDKYKVTTAAGIGGLSGPRGIGSGGPAGVNTVATPAGFGGARAAKAPANDRNPVGEEINTLFKKVEVHMGKFETVLKPLFKKLPSPAAFQGKLDADKMKIATGRASEELHKRFMSLQARVTALEKQGLGGPLIQSFVLDLAQYEKDLALHVVEAESVLKEAGKLTVSSTDAYKKQQNPVFNLEEMEAEFAKIKEEIMSADARLPQMLRRLKERMLKSLPRMESRNLPSQEVHKLAHTMASMKSATFETMKSIRQLASEDSVKNSAEMNRLFWDELGMDSQRYMATMRDLDKEEMQVSRDGGDQSAKNIDMPQMKMQGLLGSSGVTSQQLRSNTNNSSYMSKGRMTGGFAGTDDTEDSMARPMGEPLAAASQPSAYNSLPKLQL